MPTYKQLETMDSGTVVETETIVPIAKKYSSSFKSWVDFAEGKSITTVTIRIPDSVEDIAEEVMLIIDNHEADHYIIYAGAWELRCPGYVLDNVNNMVVKQEIKRMIERGVDPDAT